MKKLATLLVLGLTASMLASCAAPASSQTGLSTTPLKGTIQLMVTDAPPQDNVTSVMVSVTSARIHRAAPEAPEPEQNQGDSGEWLTLDIVAGASPFDLLVLRESGLAELLATADLPEGKYTQIRLEIDSIQVARDNGEPTEAKLPSGELKMIQPFDIVSGETTTLLVDFDADKSVTVSGAGEIIFKPVVKLTVSQ